MRLMRQRIRPLDPQPTDDVTRGIDPTAVTITSVGADDVAEDRISAAARAVIADRTIEGGTAS